MDVLSTLIYGPNSITFFLKRNVLKAISYSVAFFLVYGIDILTCSCYDIQSKTSTPMARPKILSYLSLEGMTPSSRDSTPARRVHWAASTGTPQFLSGPFSQTA